MTTAQRDTTGVRWQMPDDLRGQLLGPDGLQLAEWLRDGRATVVKDAPHRAVYRVRLPGLDCHIKHNRLLGWRSRVRELLRPIKARREFELAQTLNRRGVPTPTPLAWGVEGARLGTSASWLITETLDGGQPLLQFLEEVLTTLPPPRHAHVRRRLACVLGEFVARMHLAGVVHLDLHPGNLLVRFDADGEPHLWLIDLHTVTVGRPCAWLACQANVVVFNRYFILRASRADRLRFWNAYRRVLGNRVPEPRRETARVVEQLTIASNHQFWAIRDRRPLGTNRYFRRLRTASLRGHTVRDLAPDAIAPLLADPDRPFAEPGAVILKDSRSSTVAEFDLTVGGVVRRVVYKRFRVTDRRDPWLGLVRRGAALRSWLWGHGLLGRLLPTPRPLAVFHRTRGGLPRESYLLVEKVENALDLHAFVAQLSSRPVAELRSRVHALARLMGLLHGRGVSHRDLKATNLLTSAADGDARFWFIDLVGVRGHQRFGRRRKVQNLARLHASFASHPLLSRTEKLRFLRGYLQWGLRGKAGWKVWWRAIDAATQAKQARNARRGRPLA